MSFFFSCLSFFFKLRERERERGYIKLVIRRNGLKVYLSFSLMESCGESFFFSGLIDFILFLTLAWRKWLLPVRDIFLSSSTRSTWLWFCPVQRLTFLFIFSLMGRRCHFCFRVPANHLASLFLPLVGRFLRATRCHPSQVTEYR